MIAKNRRLRELDFLRGIAIILVLMRHQFIFKFTSNMGWIGVDLFFVLSGFLVSGLLFKEYIKFGDIKPRLFLIRRGFKIYPIYYLFYILYITPIFISQQIYWKGLFSDLFFVQNYFMDWGYAYAASWSLAVEEHFYFGLVLLLVAGKNIFKFSEKLNSRVSRFEIVILLLMLISICFRIYNNLFFEADNVKNFTMSHLRIDSLFAGVLVSYLFYFRVEFLEKYFKKKKNIFLLLSFVLLSFSPFVEPLGSFYVKTIGFTLLYISFSILLLYFLMDDKINDKLDKIFSSKLVTIVSKIGLCSYSIYIIHTFVNNMFDIGHQYFYSGKLNHYLVFLVTSVISIVIGTFMTNYIEGYFLKVRDKFYPSRIK